MAFYRDAGSLGDDIEAVGVSSPQDFRETRACAREIVSLEFACDCLGSSRWSGGAVAEGVVGCEGAMKGAVPLLVWEEDSSGLGSSAIRDQGRTKREAINAG